MIPVTKPFLPPREAYDAYVAEIWQRNWLTNFGPLSTELERKLSELLDNKRLLFLTNGTIAIQLAIKALELEGEIITTPFSYVATTSSIVWEHCEPVFVDVRREDLNVDPDLIEAAITPATTALLFTHVYGNPCDIERIQEIADRHQLKVIYDAAHCFGTDFKDKSVFAYGDVVTTSFHATKLFHTIEGGAVFARTDAIFEKLRFMRNFGHNGPTEFAEVGINAKNSEFHAAMGLCNLPYLPEIMAARKAQYLRYEAALKDVPGIRFIEIHPEATFNYAYCPIIFEREADLEYALKRLNGRQIFPRRYFYPSLATLKYVKKQYPVPVCTSIAPGVMCLPMFHTLMPGEQDMVIEILKSDR